MEDVIEALRSERQELADLVGGLDEEGLGRPSRCDGWSVADVLLHLAQTDELAVASVRGELSRAVGSLGDLGPAETIDDWAGAAVDAERTSDLTAARDRWLTWSARQIDAFEHCDPRARVQWVAGELAARTLASTRLSETWIHSGDVAAGLGVEQTPTDRLWHIARLAHRTLPYAFARAGRELHGEVAFVLRAPSGAEWVFGDVDAPTVVRGGAAELCAVAGQRRSAASTELQASGPDAAAVFELVRTFA